MKRQESFPGTAIQIVGKRAAPLAFGRRLSCAKQWSAATPQDGYLSGKFGTFHRPDRANKALSWSQVETALERLEFDKALHLAQALVAKDPKDYSGHSWLTYIYVRVGDLTQAQVHAQMAYDLFPTEDNRQRILAIERLQQQAATNPASMTPQAQQPSAE